MAAAPAQSAPARRDSTAPDGPGAAGSSAAESSSRWVPAEKGTMPRIWRPWLWRCGDADKIPSLVSFFAAQQRVQHQHEKDNDVSVVSTSEEIRKRLSTPEMREKILFAKCSVVEDQSATSSSLTFPRGGSSPRSKNVLDLLALETTEAGTTSVSLSMLGGNSATSSSSSNTDPQGKVSTEVTEVKDTLGPKERAGRAKAVAALIRQHSDHKPALRVGPLPRSWFIPDKVFEGKKKTFKTKPLFPGSPWMQLFKSFGTVTAAKIHLNPSDNVAAEGGESARPQAHLHVQYADLEELRSSALAFYGFYVEHLNGELRPSGGTIVPLEKPASKDAPRASDGHLQESALEEELAQKRREDRARKVLEGNLLTKPQFEEVEVEEIIAEEYGGVSTLGMRAEQRSAFKKCIDRLKQLEAHHKKLDKRVVELKREEMLAEHGLMKQQADAAVKQERRKKRKRARQEAQEGADGLDAAAPWKRSKPETDAVKSAPWRKQPQASPRADGVTSMASTDLQRIGSAGGAGSSAVTTSSGVMNASGTSTSANSIGAGAAGTTGARRLGDDSQANGGTSSGASMPMPDILTQAPQGGGGGGLLTFEDLMKDPRRDEKRGTSRYDVVGGPHLTPSSRAAAAATQVSTTSLSILSGADGAAINGPNTKNSAAGGLPVGSPPGGTSAAAPTHAADAIKNALLNMQLAGGAGQGDVTQPDHMLNERASELLAGVKTKPAESTPKAGAHPSSSVNLPGNLTLTSSSLAPGGPDAGHLLLNGLATAEVSRTFSNNDVSSATPNNAAITAQRNAVAGRGSEPSQEQRRSSRGASASGAVALSTPAEQLPVTVESVTLLLRTLQASGSGAAVSVLQNPIIISSFQRFLQSNGLAPLQPQALQLAQRFQAQKQLQEQKEAQALTGAAAVSSSAPNSTAPAATSSSQGVLAPPPASNSTTLSTGGGAGEGSQAAAEAKKEEEEDDEMMDYHNMLLGI
ncbi:unnamed protein product [Amoebophrya sp. A25]|nr:unnamed protein product [Amoebophrya sp. A25]|eukprot:GSA25T00010410001.1